MIALWVATAYLVKNNEIKLKSLITAIPATFMSSVSLTYILMAPEGFKLSSAVGYPAGIIFAVSLFAVYLVLSFRKQSKKT